MNDLLLTQSVYWTINSSIAQSYGFVSSRGPHFSANVCCFPQPRQLIKIVDVCKKQHQGPAKTQVLLICMDSQHILEKNTWQQRNAWCLTPQWGWNSRGVVGSAGVCDGRVSFCASSNPLSLLLSLPCELLCLVISEHRQLQPTGAHKRWCQ